MQATITYGLNVFFIQSIAHLFFSLAHQTHVCKCNLKLLNNCGLSGDYEQ